MKLRIKSVLALVVFATVLIGCRTNGILTDAAGKRSAHTSIRSTDFTSRIEYPDVESPELQSMANTNPPRMIQGEGEENAYRELSVAEAVETALANATVLKDLGGRIVGSPDTLQTVFDPAIRQSDPNLGVAGALSAFDARVSSGMFYTQNDRAVNNITLGGGTRQLEQNQAEVRNQISKRSVSGAMFTLRNINLYDSSNQPGNLFRSANESLFEAETRVPLLRGAGTHVNRIAGPDATPGLNVNGVLLARVDEDISLANFETGVRDFVSTVEEAYWELQFAYRDLRAKVDARDQALMIWQVVKARCEQNMDGGEAGKEAQAREQYYFYQNAVNNSLAGSRDGQFVGVYSSERRLRRLLGLAANDGVLLRPADMPLETRMVYDWESVLGQAVVRRVEIRRQQWQVKRAELEVIAACNLARPQLDMVALYRARGLGDAFAGSNASTALDDLFSGDHQELRLGVEYQNTIGRRQALAGVRHAKLKVHRAKAVLSEQQLQISHDVSDAIAEVDRAFESTQLSLNRLIAAKEHLDARRIEYEADRITLDLLLRAQTQLSQSQSDYFRSQVDHMIALKDVNQEIGTLLEGHQVFLSEGPSSHLALRSSAKNAARWKPREKGRLHRGQQTLRNPLH